MRYTLYYYVKTARLWRQHSVHESYDAALVKAIGLGIVSYKIIPNTSRY